MTLAEWAQALTCFALLANVYAYRCLLRRVADMEGREAATQKIVSELMDTLLGAAERNLNRIEKETNAVEAEARKL